jgi:glycosyltransferase involved in cell wall biosynthesis
MSATPPPSIAILLATYNGMPDLTAQLESYAGQTLPPAAILVSDDGSDDGTRDAVADFATRHPALGVQVLDGPRRGAAANFLSLLMQVDPGIDMVALSDQDDVWLPEKLARGAASLGELPPAVPALYCGRTWECDAQLGNRRLSRRAGKRPSFAHALVQNIAGGNTMMLNAAALALLQRAGQGRPRVVVHDWWIYQMVTGAGGTVLFDDTPQVLYRQHGKNMIGANRGLSAQLRRLWLMMKGRLRRWNTINIRALRSAAAELTPESRALLDRFAAGRDAGIAGRLAMLRRTGVYRQGLSGQVSLYLAGLFGRL